MFALWMFHYNASSFLSLSFSLTLFCSPSLSHSVLSHYVPALFAMKCLERFSSRKWLTNARILRLNDKRNIYTHFARFVNHHHHHHHHCYSVTVIYREVLLSSSIGFDSSYFVRFLQSRMQMFVCGVRSATNSDRTEPVRYGWTDELFIGKDIIYLGKFSRDWTLMEILV